MNNSDKNTFYDDVLKGNAHKNIVKTLLEKSGYKVYPFGYETLLSDVKSRLTKDTKNSRTVRRIRSSPDLLIYDEQKNDLLLIEVKMRTSCPPRIKPRLIERYKEFWDDSILVIVVKEGNVFYAQRISELETTPEYYRIADFQKLQDIFIRVREEDILHYKEIALQTMKTQKKSSIDEPEEEE